MVDHHKVNFPQTQPAAIVIDGTFNNLSVARSLVRRGIKVYVLCDSREPVRFARGVTWLRMPDNGSPASWEKFLLGPESDYLSGSMLLACSDPAIKMIAENNETLSRKFLLEEGEPETRLCLLDKLRTYYEAQEAGVPTVDFALVESGAELHGLMSRFRFPIILKPLYSPDSERLGGKFVMARNESELLSLKDRLASGIKTVAMEFVPGGDDLLCSYYCYMDEKGEPIVEFTKRLLRRSPIHTGNACYHITDWNPEAAELGRKFFKHVKLRGIGNIEFKRDLRDGRLKIIEANARFTLGTPLLVASGVDLAGITYARLTGQPVAPIQDYKKDLVFWLPAEDTRTFWQLRSRGEITFFQWLRSIARARVLPYFSWTDPAPSLYLNAQRAMQLFEICRVKLLGRRLDFPLPRVEAGKKS
ncbi:ATP-grasp domain-containing protein [Methylocystis sp. MJC1]|jgi:predicted ATP-grasp superfamily ATP-dependent carboligase|uniref:carboxylate--amine ligase n=1 Tax=Methylocystis sp. MJC1 TaxID=2654282 RepID=UPI0013E99FCE|nr:ATP-grasp domain-containing protein [Methylocystis sp. MJC1]KAF2988864.1 D-aspartate ligase [Methylocystis sp. MJC1]UZX11310.1 ATP-grasp domain-containing protein [Methylocystis sp. MJC1]